MNGSWHFLDMGMIDPIVAQVCIKKSHHFMLKLETINESYMRSTQCVIPSFIIILSRTENSCPSYWYGTGMQVYRMTKCIIHLVLIRKILISMCMWTLFSISLGALSQIDFLLDSLFSSFFSSIHDIFIMEIFCDLATY